MSAAIAIVGQTSEHGAHCPLEALATGVDEIPVVAMQNQDGYHLTNRYADGVRGVAELDAQEAELDENPWCQCCRELVSEWQHGSADDWAARR